MSNMSAENALVPTGVKEFCTLSSPYLVRQASDHADDEDNEVAEGCR